MLVDARLAALEGRIADRLDAPFPRGDAAVLLLVARLTETTNGIVLTRRADSLATDAGFVAFPGGRIDDGESPEEAACRECEEEVGIPRRLVTIHGRLDDTWNGAGFRIVPVVGSVTGPVVLRPRHVEVSASAVVPLDAVVSDANHSTLDVEIEGHTFLDDVIEFSHGDDSWRLYGPTADLARDLAVWLQGSDRRQRARRQLELDHFAAVRGW